MTMWIHSFTSDPLSRDAPEPSDWTKRRSNTMKLSSHQLAGLLGLTAVFLILIAAWAFAPMRPDYSAISQTISELGEFGSSISGLVSFGLFLPIGLLIWLAIFPAPRSCAGAWLTSPGRLTFASVGPGYMTAAFFPCDPGSPLIGSWRQQIHHLFGLVEDLGGGIGRMALGRLLRASSPVIRRAFILSGGTVLVSLALRSIRNFFGTRRFIQRVAEIIPFGWPALVSIALIFRRRPWPFNSAPGSATPEGREV